MQGLVEKNMSEEQLEVAQENARNNYQLIVSRIPPRLAQREENLFEKFLKHRGSALTQLQALYEFMDEVNGFVSQFTPCKKGCSSCCYYSVSISGLEILYIETKTKVKRLKRPLPKSNFHGLPCPFLQNGGCSIYEHRPFFCRRHTTLCRTPTWCHPDICNSEKFPLLGFSEIDKSYAQIIQKSGLDERADTDIRQVFWS
jgi:Fe-S-cluster containining protein